MGSDLLEVQTRLSDPVAVWTRPSPLNSRMVQTGARAMLPGIEGSARECYVCGFNEAGVYAVLGDKQQALAWLEKAYRDRSD